VSFGRSFACLDSLYSLTPCSLWLQVLACVVHLVTACTHGITVWNGTCFGDTSEAHVPCHWWQWHGTSLSWMRSSHLNQGANLAAAPMMDLLLLFTALAHTTPRNTFTVWATPTVPPITKYACTQLWHGSAWAHLTCMNVSQVHYKDNTHRCITMDTGAVQRQPGGARPATAKPQSHVLSELSIGVSLWY